MMRQSLQNGFTLIETLVAVFSLSLLMTAGGALMISTLDSNKLVEERLTRLQALEVATAHLRADLAQTVPRIVESDLAGVGQQSLFGGLPDRNGAVLGLVRGGWANLENAEDRGGLLALEYRVQDDRFVRHVYERPDRTRATPAFQTVLLDGVESVEMGFIDAGLSADQWELVLDGSTPQLPQAVSVDILFETGERLTQTFLVGAR